MRRPVVPAVALCALLACGGPTASPPIQATTPAPGHVQKTVKARLDMRVSGAETLELKTDTDLHIVEIVGGRQPMVTWFLSVSAKAPIPLRDGRTLMFTADLSPGLYRGPGTYTMSEKGAVNVEGTTSPLGSAAYVMFLTLRPKPAQSRFDELKESCTLTVGSGAASGTVTCSTLGRADGKTVSIRWSWELI